MKSFLRILLILLNSFIVYGQHSITGIVKDSLNNTIEFANVILTNEQGKIITGTITNEKGSFKLLSKQGVYSLEISFLGYEKFSQKIILNKSITMAKVILIETKNELDEVLIFSKKKLIQQKVDRLIFNVENSVSSSNGNALDILKVTPGISVQNSGISIIGKQNVNVMINDRIVQLSGEELTSYLESLASDDIKNIEVITAPPSKYDAEGNSGLINIVLKKTEAESWSNNIRSAYIQTTYPAISIGNTFNYNSGKIQLSASVNGKKGNEQEVINTDLYFPNETWIGETVGKNKKDYVSGRFGLDYQINKKSTIGMLYSGNASNRDVADVDIIDIFSNEANTDYIVSNGNDDKSGHDHSINIHYSRTLDTLNRKLSIDVDYFNYKNAQNRVFDSERFGIEQSYFKANNISDQIINNYSFRLDVEHPSKFGNFSYGFKATKTETDNIIDFFDLTSGSATLDNTQSDNFNYIENIQSVYIDLSKSFKEKWQTKLGFRIENTQTKGFSLTENQENINNYTKLFPSIYLNYNANENNSFNISYNKRIRRPNFWELNPFRWYLNINSYAVGNPFLLPEISDNFEIKHTYKSNLISKVFLSITDNGFSQIPSVDIDTNQQIYTQQNFYTGYVYGINETFIYDPFQWWNTVSQLTIYKLDADLKENIDLGTNLINGINYQFYTNHSFFFNESRTIQAEATLVYNGNKRVLFFEVDPSMSLDIGLRISSLDKKLQFNMGVEDIFKTLASNNTTYTNGIKQVYKSYYDSRYFKIGLSYRFGNKKIQVKKHEFGNDEEKNRVY